MNENINQVIGKNQKGGVLELKLVTDNRKIDTVCFPFKTCRFYPPKLENLEKGNKEIRPNSYCNPPNCDPLYFPYSSYG
ncbi:hypothetical protein CL616_04350 [archaeon]|nr:hypothetical protein [archaeon]